MYVIISVLHFDEEGEVPVRGDTRTQLAVCFTTYCKAKKTGTRFGWRPIRAIRFGKLGEFGLPGIDDVITIGEMEWRCTRVTLKNSEAFPSSLEIETLLVPAHPASLVVPARKDWYGIPAFAEGDTAERLFYRLELAGHYVYIDTARKEGTYEIVGHPGCK